MSNFKVNNGMFIFRRDLRIIDNNGLNLLKQHCKNIFTIFIFTPEQVSKNNQFKSNNAVQFMIESLTELAYNIKQQGGHLYTFYGNNDNIVKECIKYFNIDVVAFNLDYSPYARNRDQRIINICNKHNVKLICPYDYYLHDPGVVLNGAGQTYQKFTPFYQQALKTPVNPPNTNKLFNFYKKGNQISNLITLEQAKSKFTKINPNILVHGGRQQAIKVLNTALKTQKHYASTHNTLHLRTTTLSAYIKFGCLSIREVYKQFKGYPDIIRQLYWRDFYANILFSYPFVLHKSLKPKYDHIKWNNKKSWFDAWCNGNTGVPVVDAGMRELNTTGFCHNRSRLIVMSFLIKILLIDYKKGEKYFATMLTDYDPASNNGNVLWVMGGGADSQPYYRYFNPYLQSKEHDPDCLYIKKWVPELIDVPNNDIHNWFKTYMKYSNVGYPKPIVDYDEQKEKSIQMYSTIFRS